MAIVYGAQQNIGGNANASALNQPKELGILDRAAGLRSGLQVLRLRLESFTDRLEGNGGEKSNSAAPVSASLTGTFSDAEGELRLCMQLAEALNDRF